MAQALALKNKFLFKTQPGWLGPGLWLVLYTGAFFLFSFPIHAISYEAYEVAQNRRTNYESFYNPERDPAGNAYSWTRPIANLYFVDVPRYAPLRFQINLSLNRPAGVLPAEINFSEVRGPTKVPLGTLRPDPAQPGFQDYEFTIPACPECQVGTQIQIESNWFRVDGDQRALGVIVKNYSLEMGAGHWRYLLWPQPYLLVALLLGLGLVGWFAAFRLPWLWGALLLVPVTFYLALFQIYLIDDCLWLSVWAAGLGLTALGWARSSLKWRKWWLIAGVSFFVAFMCVSPASATDMKLFLFWVDDLGRNPYGPFDIYRHSPRLDYLPLIAYILWPYRVITGWFGASNSVALLKIFYSLPVILIVWLIWSYLAQSSIFKKRQPAQPLDAGRGWDWQALALLGFGITMVFDPAVWGQTDAIMCLMLALNLIFINQRWAYPAGIMLGLSVIFKPQAWFVAPFFAFLLLLRFGWKRGFLAGLAGGIVALALAVPAFGFDAKSFSDFWFQPSLGGNLGKGSSFAYNVIYLLGYGDAEPPDWIVYGGFAIIALAFGLAGWLTWRQQQRFKDRLAELSWDGLVAALLVAVVFLFAIKMRERYLDYALLFLAMAALRNRRLFLPFTLFNGLCLLNMLAIYLGDRKEKVPSTFFVWRQVMSAPAMPYIVAALSLAVFGWLVYLLVRDLKTTGTNKPETGGQDEIQSLQLSLNKP